MYTAFLNLEGINFYFNFFKCILYLAPFAVLCEVSKPLCEVPCSNFMYLSYFSSCGWFPSTLVSRLSIPYHSSWTWTWKHVLKCTVLNCVHHRTGCGSAPIQTVKLLVMNNFQLSKGLYIYIFSGLVTNLTGTNASYFPPHILFQTLETNYSNFMITSHTWL